MIEVYVVPDPRLRAIVAHNAVADTHRNWQISDVVVKCDVAEVDTGVANTHAKLAQEGGQFFCI
eukprot:3539572-Prorocentrum_lima.AAC.1